MAAPANDVKLKALRLQLLRTTGTIHELELLYAQFLGGSFTKATVQAWKEAFDELGEPPGPMPQRWYRYIESLGFTDFAIPEREHDYWSVAAGLLTIDDERITGSGDTRITGDGDIRITEPGLSAELFLVGRVTGDNEGRTTADGDRRVYE